MEASYHVRRMVVLVNCYLILHKAVGAIWFKRRNQKVRPPSELIVLVKIFREFYNWPSGMVCNSAWGFNRWPLATLAHY
jgi:hypothetical protein